MTILCEEKFRKFIVVLFIAVGCTGSELQGDDLQKYRFNEKLVVEEVLQNVSLNKNRFLVFPKDLCRTCFREIVSHFEEKNYQGHVILLGANDYDIKRLNAIYQNSLKFWRGIFENYDALIRHIQT